MVKLVRALVPVVAGAAMVTLAGCSTPPGGTAVQVDGQRVSNSVVDDSTTGCVKVISTASRASVRPQIASMYLEGLIANAVAAKKGISITQEDKDALVASGNLGLNKALFDGGSCQAAIEQWLSLAVVQQKVGSSALLTAAHQLDVTVNPQYGTYNARQLAIDSGSGSLSGDGTPSIVVGE